MSKNKGFVSLVGAGPGDPGLITVKGFSAIRKADVIIYDYLANPALLQLRKPNCRLEYVGKKGATHAKQQEDIHRLLIREAKRGKNVVRLKGGDPFVFGRGGEEAEALREAHIPFDVVPGVTSAIAVPAYAGIPVTHRDFTSTVAFVTGHEKDESGRMPIDWNALSKIGTVVFLMGFGNLSQIASRLIQAGRSPETPAAVVEWGTYPRQRTVSATLTTLADKVRQLALKPPTVIVVGDVIGLREKINWFEEKPLFGKKILVTRARSQASELKERLEALGASVVEMPTIEIRPPSHWKSLDHAVKKIESYDWLIFTSVNGVRFFFERFRKFKMDVRHLNAVKIAVIGPATADALIEMNLHPDVVAKKEQAEGLLKDLTSQKIRGKRLLIPRAKEGRELLIDGLRKKGAHVDVVEAYRTTLPSGSLPIAVRAGRAGRFTANSGENPDGSPPNPHRANISAFCGDVTEEKSTTLSWDQIDLMTFASSSTVENFVKIVGSNHQASQKIPVACIGPITSATAKRYGFKVLIQPKRHLISDLVAEIEKYFG